MVRQDSEIGTASFVSALSRGWSGATTGLDEVERRSALSTLSPTGSRDPRSLGSVQEESGVAGLQGMGLSSRKWPSLLGKKTPSADDLLAMVNDRGGESGDTGEPAGLGTVREAAERLLKGDGALELSPSPLGFGRNGRGSAMTGKKSASADDVMRLGRKKPVKGILKKSASVDNIQNLGRRSRSLSPSEHRPSKARRIHRNSESIDEMPALEEPDRQKSISLADIDAETLEKLVAEQALGPSEETDAMLEADDHEGAVVEPLFVPSEQGSASTSRAGWIPRALRAGAHPI